MEDIKKKFKNGKKKFWTVKEFRDLFQTGFSDEDKVYFDCNGRLQIMSTNEDTNGMVLSVKQLLEDI